MSPHPQQAPHEMMLSRAEALANRLDPIDGSHPSYSTVQDQLRDLSAMTAISLRLSAPMILQHYETGGKELPRKGVSVLGLEIPVVDLAKLILAAMVLLCGLAIVGLMLGRDVTVTKDGLDMRRSHTSAGSGVK